MQLPPCRDVVTLPTFDTETKSDGGGHMKLREFYKMHANDVFGMMPSEAYELQRALRFEDRFPDRRSGPGGGIDADHFTGTFFTIAALIDGPRKDIGDRVWGYWNIGSRCDLTGQEMFGEALKAVLADERLSLRVTEVGVYRSTMEAWIEYRDGPELKEIKRTHFVDDENVGRSEENMRLGTMRTQAVIGGSAIYAMHQDLITEANKSQSTE